MIRVVRLGSPRAPGEGLRIGTVRRPPRGVKASEFGARDYYDVWLPELAPSDELLRAALAEPWTDARWRAFEKRYRREMKAPHARHLMAMLATLSRQTNLAVGCYCEDASRCHRRVLARLLAEAGAEIAADSAFGERRQA